MTTFREFIPYFTNDVPGLPRQRATDMARRVAIEFLEWSHVLEKDANSILVRSDKHTYTPTFSDNLYRAISIQKARFYDSDDVSQGTLRVTNWDDMESLKGKEWDQETTTAEPSQIILALDNKFRLYPIPTTDSDYDLRVTCCVTLVRSATEIDDYIFENFVEDIANGCRAYLMQEPKQQWSNPMGAKYEMEYWQGIRNARKQTLGGKGETSAYVKPRDFMNMFGAY